MDSELVYGEWTCRFLLKAFQVNLGLTVNHSCEPNVAFDLSSDDQAEWHVRALRRIEAGEDGE